MLVDEAFDQTQIKIVKPFPLVTCSMNSKKTSVLSNRPLNAMLLHLSSTGSLLKIGADTQLHTFSLLLGHISARYALGICIHD